MHVTGASAEFCRYASESERVTITCCSCTGKRLRLFVQQLYHKVRQCTVVRTFAQ